MKKDSPFHEAKPRTSKSAARQREAKAMEVMADLANLGDEEEYKKMLAELFEIKPGHPRYEKAMTTWREIQRGRT